MKLKDTFWLWGHPEGCFNNGQWDADFFGESRMTPTEACNYLGIDKVFMVPFHHEVNRRQYNKSFSKLKSVGWECFGADKSPEKVEQIIADSSDFPNISAAVFDDFFGQKKQRIESGDTVDPRKLWQIRKRLNENKVRRIDMWMVVYTREFGLDGAEDEDAKQYLAPFDGLIMWTWHERDIRLAPKKFEILKTLSPSNRKMFGCYLYNFGERKEATAEAVKWQLDFYREKILSGEAEGIVFHTNTMADMDFAAYDAALEWINEHGEEEIEPPVSSFR